MRTTISMLSVAGFVLAMALTSDFGSAWAQTSCDFTTGGGFILRDSGAHGNFGVGGGCKNGSPTWGHLEYHDHGNGLNAHGTGVTGYFFINPTTRDISGTARTNDPSHPNVNYCVEVSDNDASGGQDTFVIQLQDQSSGAPFYTTQTDADHTLHGGDIQLHKPNPSTTGSFSSGSCLVTACAGTPASCGVNGACVTCASGAVCTSAGACACAGTPASCGTNPAACVTCAAGQSCTNGQCVSACSPQGTSCTANAQCCSNICFNGFCTAPF